MAFTPNQTGLLYRPTARDIYGRAVWSDPQQVGFAVVNSKQKEVKTSVRADSSASRGMGDEITTDLGRILVAKNVQIEIGDMFEFDGYQFDVASKHIRRSVTGEIDHFECDLEVRPK